MVLPVCRSHERPLRNMGRCRRPLFPQAQYVRLHAVCAHVSTNINACLGVFLDFLPDWDAYRFYAHRNSIIQVNIRPDVLPGWPFLTHIKMTSYASGLEQDINYLIHDTITHTHPTLSLNHTHNLTHSNPTTTRRGCAPVEHIDSLIYSLIHSLSPLLIKFLSAQSACRLNVSLRTNYRFA